MKNRTGFSIGGVAPLAHATPVITLIDQSLFRFDELWAAAGHPQAVFRLSPKQLQRLTDAPVADMALEADEEKLALQRAITLVTLRLRMVDNAADVPSLCISICRMNARTELCEGCFRTRDEIAVWSSAGDDGKGRIWSAIGQRMQALQI